MKQKNYTQQFWNDLEKHILDHKKQNPSEPLIAAFDADGTIWDADVGESFSMWQFKNCQLKNLPKDPWRFYRDEKETGDPQKAFMWLAQINAGHSLDQVRQWAKAFTQTMEPVPFFEPQKALIGFLKGHGVKVYVVTASIKWSVEPGALQLGIDYENVLGVCTKVESGMITDIPVLPVTWKDGKAKTLLLATNGKAPFLCCGNTHGDIALIESSSKFKIAVGSSKPSDELFESEKKLFDYCKKLDWIKHHFYADPTIFSKS
jgi:phosphoserine phosphatase